MSPQQPKTTHCQKCGTLLDQQLPGGLCQSCLWTGLIEDDMSGGSLAIGFAHERGIIHRDLKPSNILFDGSNHPYIADFGLAKWAHAESGVTQSNYLPGSPSYLAPEAAAKDSKATTSAEIFIQAPPRSPRRHRPARSPRTPRWRLPRSPISPPLRRTPAR